MNAVYLELGLSTANPSSVNFIWVFAFLAGGAGLTLMSRKRRAWGPLLMLIGAGIVGVACIRVGPSTSYDYNQLDVTLGELELVVPAEKRLHARLSPDGRWLALFNMDAPSGYRLIDIEKNIVYEDLGEGGTPAMWLDEHHLVFSHGEMFMLRVPDMVTWPLQKAGFVGAPEDTLGELVGAEHIYAVDVGSTYSLMTTDSALAYVVETGFGASPGAVNKDLENYLADHLYTIIAQDGFVAGWTEPAYSPDGQYYVNGRPFDDPTGHSGKKPAVFSADGQEVGYGYKYGWHQIFLGWAYDSSGAYFLYQPASPDGDLLYQKWPLYKVLIPSATPRGTPAQSAFP